MKSKKNDINKFEFAKIDWEKIKKEEKRKKEALEKAEKEEEERVKNLKCPVCLSIEKYHEIKTDHNGIIGPGGRSWITESYFICLNCGIMYKDLKKIKEE